MFTESHGSPHPDTGELLSPCPTNHFKLSAWLPPHATYPDSCLLVVVKSQTGGDATVSPVSRQPWVMYGLLRTLNYR